MKTICTVITILLISIGASAQDMDHIFNGYLKVKNALVESNSKLTATAVGELTKTIETTTEFTQKSALLKSIKKIAKSSDLEKQRIAFAEVSIIMWEAVSNDKNFTSNVYYQYCPMKKAYWLSEEEAIKNPYYGVSMLSCGNISDKKIK